MALMERSKVLSSEEVEQFLKEAPDDKFLATKISLIFGITGSCRREELANLKMKDVQYQGEILVVKIPDTKTKITRTFTIEKEFLDIVTKYEALRPPNANSDRFFF